MPSYGEKSQRRLSECHPDLQVIFNEVIKHFDNSILCGHRGELLQNSLYAEGKTKVRWPDSKHNKKPSMATDSAPYPVDWQDIKRFYLFAGYVLATAEQLFQEGKITHRLRWGGDWDLDTEVTDQKFNDLVHFELIKAEF